MTAIALPTRKPKSKPARVAKSAAKTWASLKIGSTAAKTAKKGAKTWASFKVVQFVGKGGKKLLLVPLAAGGGFVAWKKVRSSSESSASDGPATPYGSPMGPAATPQTVTPPKTAPGSAADLNGEGSMSDSPAGATNPPVNPPGSTS